MDTLEFILLLGLIVVGGFFFGWGYNVLGREGAENNNQGWWLYALGFLCVGIMAFVVLV